MISGKPRRVATLALILCLSLAGGALAAALGEIISGYETFLGSGMELSQGVYWTGSDYRTENYIEYSKNSKVRPVVVSGSKVCNYGSFSSMARLLEKQGKHVIAGINGDYYVMANYEPLGILIENGNLLSSDAGHYGVGFFDDGSAVFGKPSLMMSLEINGESLPLSSVNKTRTAGTTALFTDSYAQKTKVSGGGTELICSISGGLRLNSSRTLTVEEVLSGAGSVAIPAGKTVLSVSDSSIGAEILKELKPEDTLTLNISAPQDWANVTYAIGSLYKLVTDGKVDSSLPAGSAPRTAVGQKADGSLVFYTMDGRQPSHSIGVSMSQLAERMIELGCVEATIMDGGGSTSLNAIYLGDSSASQINNPSDGYQRSVTNYIMLMTEEKPTGVADSLALYPLSTHMMAGAKTNFTLKAADENGYATQADVPVSLAVTEGFGSILPDGTFTASGEGVGAITATGEGLKSAVVQVNVVKTPDILRVFRQGTSTAVTSLSVKSGTKTDLMAEAMDNYVYLISQDSCYEWTVQGEIGSINSEGVFTAGEKSATGSINVKAGEKTVVIPVTVTSSGRYDDVSENSWYYEAVEYVSEKGLMTGTANRVFSPDSPMSRAMVVTVLHRMEGLPAAEGQGIKFTDVKDGSWYSEAVYWASSKGIVMGYGETFNPDSPVTREELAAILHRYKGQPLSEKSLAGFSDAGEVSDWAKTSMSWAYEKGIINGISQSVLSPKGQATRAQLATILQRLA
ncbi:MAG: hypothetical protein GX025_02680 [Clostridiales bacterium]|nr:hypothetical protein [Clostridiales bacterium]